MLWRLFAVSIFVVSSFGFVSGQDAFKVEPKHYKLDFENETVQVVNVHYGPHEKSSLHSHPGGVVVALTSGHLRFTDEHGKIRETHTLAGESRWFPPFKHIVENLGDTSYNAVYIGIKGDHKSGALRKGKGQLAALAKPGDLITPDAKTRELIAQALALAK